MKENIIGGQYFRILKDKANEEWDRLSFWTKGSDVYMDVAPYGTPDAPNNLVTALDAIHNEIANLRTDLGETIDTKEEAIYQEIGNVISQTSVSTTPRTERVARLQKTGANNDVPIFSTLIDYTTDLYDNYINQQAVYILLPMTLSTICTPIWLPSEVLLDSDRMFTDLTFSLDAGGSTPFPIRVYVSGKSTRTQGNTRLKTGTLNIELLENGFLDIYKKYI